MDETAAAKEKTARTTAAVPRGWRSLLTGRWHRSSWVVTALVLLLLVFCNLPGQLVTTISLSDEFPPPSGLLSFFWGIEETTSYEHGWPFAYLVRPDDHSPAFDSPTVWNCWALWMNKPQMRSWAIAVNAIVALALAALAGAAFEGWRRRRQNVWQLHLRDVMALILAISLAGAWYAAQQHRYRREQSILGPAQQQDTGWSSQETSPPVVADPFGPPGAITWIRLLAGERALGFLDRVRFIIVTRRGLPQMAQFPDVRFVYVEGPATNGELRHLGQLPRLVAVEMSLSGEGSGSPRRDDVLELPEMPQLKSLVISGARTRCEGFEQLKALDALDLSGCYLDNEMLREIGRMPRLRRLNLSSTDLPPGGLAPLKSLRRLEELILDNREVSSDTLADIVQLASLKRLSLRSASLPGDSLQHLAALDRLDTLYLNESDLRTSKAIWLSDFVQGFAWKSRIPVTAVDDLQQMKQLRVLSLGKTTLPQKEIDSLKAALPQCDVRAN